MTNNNNNNYGRYSTARGAALNRGLLFVILINVTSSPLWHVIFGIAAAGCILFWLLS